MAIIRVSRETRTPMRPPSLPRWRAGDKPVESNDVVIETLRFSLAVPEPNGLDNALANENSGCNSGAHRVPLGLSSNPFNLPPIITMTKKVTVILAALLAAISVSPAQTLTPLVHPPPGGANLAFQLTDGTVMCQANREQDWWKLTPDITGSYVNGTWTKLPSLQPGYVPADFASAVLADGRLVITGASITMVNLP